MRGDRGALNERPYPTTSQPFDPTSSSFLRFATANLLASSSLGFVEPSSNHYSHSIGSITPPLSSPLPSLNLIFNSIV